MDKVKAPLLKVILRLAVHYPDPRIHKITSDNANRMLSILDKIDKYHHNLGRHSLLLSALRILIGEYEHDDYYAFLFDWAIAELINSGWKPENRGFPMWKYWNGPLIECEYPDWQAKQMQDKLGIVKLNLEVNSDVKEKV